MRKFLTFIMAALLCCAALVGASGCSGRTAATDKVAAVTAPVLNSAGNPYEDPNDPNTKPGEGTCISTDTYTGYFMEVKLTNQTTGIIDPQYRDFWDSWSSKYYWTDTINDATAILTFKDILYNGQPIFATVFTKVLYTAKSCFHEPRMWCQEDFTEAKGNALRIPKSYYNFIKWAQENTGGSLRHFNLTFMKNYGKDVMVLKYTQEVDVRLYTAEVDEDIDDPTSPNFKLDNWTAIMSAATKGISTGCDAFFAWLKKNWIVVVIGIAALIAVCILIKFLRWAFGKK